MVNGSDAPTPSRALFLPGVCRCPSSEQAIPQNGHHGLAGSASHGAASAGAGRSGAPGSQQHAAASRCACACGAIEYSLVDLFVFRLRLNWINQTSDT